MEYISLYRKLFQSIHRYAGKMQDYNITKKEWVLDGATVLHRSVAEFLELFLRNLLLNETNPLHNRSMHISGMFDGFQKQDIGTQEQDIEAQKQDIEAQKQYIGTQKQYIEIQKWDIDILKIYNSQLKKTSFSKKTLEHIQKLYDKFGNGKVFARAEVMAVLGITASPASELIKKLLGIEIIVPVQGKGKGKYVFKAQ